MEVTRSDCSENVMRMMQIDKQGLPGIAHMPCVCWAADGALQGRNGLRTCADHTSMPMLCLGAAVDAMKRSASEDGALWRFFTANESASCLSTSSCSVRSSLSMPDQAGWR